MKIDRLISIIMLLLEKERISAKELSDMFEVSKRTIYRDIDTINMAGIPIYATTGLGGGFEIMKEYKVNNKVFSSSELSAILTGLTGMNSMIHGNDLLNALAKVKSFIPADRAKEIELKSNQIIVDLNPWLNQRNTEHYLQIIHTSLEDHKRISFEYFNHQGDKTSRIVEPYQLLLKNSHWYLYGYALEREDYRVFRLSRMTSLKILEEDFIPRDFPKLKLDFNEVLNELQTEIKLRIHESILERILDYCSFEDLVSEGIGYYLVSFPFIENDFYYDILLGFSDKCECLEPVHVRHEMRRRIGKMMDLYKEE